MPNQYDGLTRIERFWQKVDKNAPGDCWQWTAHLNADGYGNLRITGKAQRAHRWSYEHFVGPIPAGFEIDHLCRNRGCVNPEHLEPVTKAENQLRGVGFVAIHAAQTHCVNGHKFDEANTYRYVERGHARRYCRACNNAHSRKRNQRRTAARLALNAVTAS